MPSCLEEELSLGCKKAKLQAGIKPTALCLVIDKENSKESLLDLLHCIYNYYCGYASCLPHFTLVIKKRKEILNNDLAILPSYNTTPF